MSVKLNSVKIFNIQPGFDDDKLNFSVMFIEGLGYKTPIKKDLTPNVERRCGVETDCTIQCNSFLIDHALSLLFREITMSGNICSYC